CATRSSRVGSGASRSARIPTTSPRSGSPSAAASAAKGASGSRSGCTESAKMRSCGLCSRTTRDEAAFAAEPLAVRRADPHRARTALARSLARRRPDAGERGARVRRRAVRHRLRGVPGPARRVPAGGRAGAGAAGRAVRGRRRAGTRSDDPQHARCDRAGRDRDLVPAGPGGDHGWDLGRPRRRGCAPRLAGAGRPVVRPPHEGAVPPLANYATRVQNWVLTELDSGERVISERLDHVRSAAVGYWIGAGSRDEQAGEAGVTHFIEHLLFKGTSRYSALEIAEIFDGLGGELNAATSREHTLVYARVPDHHLETAMDVMGDMVFSPTFSELDAEREVVLEEIAMYDDAPQELVHDLIAEAVFGDHPLGRPVIGTAEVISGIERESIARYHHEMYVPGNIVVAAAGNIEHDRIVELVERALEGRATTSRKQLNTRPPLVSAPPPKLRFLRKDTEQYHVCLAAPGISRSDRRRFAASLLDSILGGSASSRL